MVDAFQDPERPVLEHLSELRKRVLRCAWLMGIGAVAAGLLFPVLADIVRGQLKDAFAEAGHPEDFSSALLSLSPTDVVSLVFKFALAGGFFLALPMILVQLWGFVSSGLRTRERKVGAWLLTAGPCLFVIGFLFSFYQLMPLTAVCLLKISYYYGFIPRWTAESYFGFFLILNLAFAACFELPLVMVVLSATGLVHPSMYGRYRRHWVLASFVIGGLLPPPEAVSMFIQAGALVVLYEFGILFSKLFVTRQRAAQAQSLA